MAITELEINPNDAQMLAQLAWNITRPDGDPRWENTIQSHRDKLLTHAQDVIKTGTAVTDFEKEVQRLRTEALKESQQDNERKFAARREEEVEIAKRRKQSQDVMAREAQTLQRINSGVPSHALHAEDAQRLEGQGVGVEREQAFDQTDASAKETNPIGQRPSLKDQRGVKGEQGSATSAEGGNPALDANSPIEPEGSEQASGENDGTGDEASKESPKAGNEKAASKSASKSSSKSSKKK